MHCTTVSKIVLKENLKTYVQEDCITVCAVCLAINL
jgi:hypothetical protein